MFLPITVAALLGGAIALPESPPAIEPRQTGSETPARTGNWSTLSCDTDGYSWGTNHSWTPMERWGRTDCKHAWDDVIAEWKDYYRPQGQIRFSFVVLTRYGRAISRECGTGLSLSWSACPVTASCSDHRGGTVPAGAEVSNAFSSVHEMFQTHYKTIPALDNTLLTTYQTFSKDLKYQVELFQHPTFKTSTLGVAALVAAASSFNAYLHSAPYFTYHPPSVLRASLTTLVQSLASRVNTTDPTITGFYDLHTAWGSTVEDSALHLFRGSDASIDKVTALIVDGRMSPGASAPGKRLTDDEQSRLSNEAELNAGKVMHLMLMPAMWELAGAGVVVVPAKGEGCEDPTGKARRPEGVGEEAAEAGWVCEGGKVYYLVGVRGGGKIGVPRGLERLNAAEGNATFGGVKRGELVVGAVRTFERNGRKNGVEPDFAEDSDLVTGLYESGIATPGLVRLPVCSAEEASANGKKDERWDVYPCNMVEGSVAAVPASGAMRGSSGGWLRPMLSMGLLMFSLVLL